MEMPPLGSHMHPIEISSGSASYAGSPYQSPNEWDQYWNQFTFVKIPSQPTKSYSRQGLTVYLNNLYI
ncbi:hypothetical protein HanIR_Chr05g0211861 [Helianthus annuus]|nr:hypothetical protein HanIR_Chr05g0211861 [Helianthus annuus]